MKASNSYKEHIKTVDSVIAKDMEKSDDISSIISAMVEQRIAMGLTQRELAIMCGIHQSSIARIESCNTTPNLRTLLNILQHLDLKLTVTSSKTTL